MRIYLSGPMTGREDLNYPTFNRVAAQLREQGHTVINPAENFDGADDRERKEYMRLDVEHVLSVDAIAVLPGWEESRGARLEVAIARELELPVLDALTMEPHDFTVKDEVRATASTGAQKGRKPEMMSLLPWPGLAKTARHYGVGMEKYGPHNWRAGYPWTWSIDALLRHALAYANGETIDEETGSSHMAGVAFHAFALLTFEDEHPELDDRYVPV